MAENYAARKDGAYKVVGMAPDLCFTPGSQSPVPYPVQTTLDSSASTINSVKFNGHPAFIFNQSFVPKTIGDAAGTNKGVTSGTVEGNCWPIEHSPDTNIGGSRIIRVQDMFFMNGSFLPGMLGMTKSQRWKYRKHLIELGKSSGDKDVQAAANRLELDNTAVEKARLASVIYDGGEPSEPTPGMPEGWTDISNDAEALKKINLKPENLIADGAPGFRARVYAPDPAVFGDDMKTSVVFRGTRKTEIEDWTANFNQGVDKETGYYKQAVIIGKNLPTVDNVDVVGHSLGGGLASSAAEAGNVKGWTFNAAGLNQNTLSRYSGSSNSGGAKNIDAFRVKGEILTDVQEINPGRLLEFGLKYGPGLAMLKAYIAGKAPDSVGIRHDLSGGEGNPVTLHGMEQVIHCLELEKDQDIATITGEKF
ncbi:PAAR-like domain-containing protein [Candidatus Pantoea soli]|uniref:DUF4150 domain-containing protein n=1 Tax=Candidatus Pantoea soli TaxID=3098669 RepID=A0A518X9L1_9GAMM|nr:PAAR-like domain-containing protein [Pantoea soli]QDY40893.1 DUF4150 domain-containing protein [Pantoea soli]